MWPDALQLVPQLQRALLEELQQAPSLEGLLGWIEVSGRVNQLESTFPNPNPKALILTLNLTLTLILTLTLTLTLTLIGGLVSGEE